MTESPSKTDTSDDLSRLDAVALAKMIRDKELSPVEVVSLTIERIERLEEEKNNILSDIKEVYSEAKSSGYEPKIMRKVLLIRKMDVDERLEQEALLDTYRNALGIF